MERILKRQLDAIARDRSSGAAELTLRACEALLRWHAREPRAGPDSLMEVARAILRVQPSMAPLAHLANEVALASENGQRPEMVSRRIRTFGTAVQTASTKIAAHFARWTALRSQPEIFTYSYSSSVLAALVRARRRIHGVSCSESRPGNEGMAMANRLARAKIRTTYLTDAGLLSQLWGKQVVVLGADAVLNNWIAGKVGIKVLTARARQLRCPVVFLVDTSKFWPEQTSCSPRLNWTWESNETLWKNPPPRVHVYNLLIEFIPLAPSFRFLTERGWMTREQVRHAIRQIRISPRLEALMKAHD